MTRTDTAACIVLMLTLACAAHGAELTIERLFADPDLSGPSLRLLKVAPDGARVTFLRAKQTDRYRFDLWEYNVAAGKARLLVDSLMLAPGKETLSDEEKARRERQRISAHRGIVEYYFSQDGSALLFPLQGDLYVYDLTRPAGEATRRLTHDTAAETDPKFSPRRGYVSFVRDQDLYVIDLRDGSERRLTHDGGGVIRNAMAEFIAQEEMDRDTGYWWSPDERFIAFTRTDDTPVDEVERFEIHADAFAIYSQRYPATGTDNVRIQLGVVELAGGAVTWVDLGDDEDIYLPRVDWFPDSAHLLARRQSRDQKQLDLLKVVVASGDSQTLLTETSDTWIDLHHDLAFLEDRDAFIWSSARTGFKHLYLYDLAGNLLRALTAGDWMVNGNGGAQALLAVDEAAGKVFFMGTKDSPLERHLYSAALETTAPGQVTRITREPGWHIVEVSDNAQLYVDNFSSPRTPPRVSIHRMDGTPLSMLVENRLDERHPYHPYLPVHSFPEFGTVESEDGQTLHYRLIKPSPFDPARHYPVIVDVYGGPGGQRVKRIWSGYPRTTDGMWRQLLARSGYIVFTLDNRGTSFRGTAFDAPIYRRLGQVEVRDQVSGVQFLRSLPYVDPERIGVFGWSYGGYMALMTMMQAPEHFAAGVSGAPVTDWLLYDTHYTERYLGHPGDDGSAYEDASVFSYVEGLQGPLLVIHGMADDNVLFSHSTRLFKTLQDLGKPFDTAVYPGSKHGMLRHRAAGMHAYAAIKRFFDTNLAAPGNAAVTDGQAGDSGRLVGIARRGARRAAMEALDDVGISIEAGLDGDYAGTRRTRQVTVLAREAWEAAIAAIGGDASLPWTARRANLLVEEVMLPRAKGGVIRIGDCVLEVTGQTVPCRRMDEAVPGLRKALSPDWRGGVTCRVRAGAVVKAGDRVEVLVSPPERKIDLPG